MKKKYQSKYLSKEEPFGKKKNPTVLVVVLAFVLVTAVIVGILHFQEEKNPRQQESTTSSTGDETQEKINYVAIETAYGTLQFDEDYVDMIRHMEVSEGGATTEVFYMLLEDGERELFRICFGDAAIGDLIGKVQADGQEIPVSVVVCTYAEEDFLDEETLNNYYALMDQLNVVLASIRSGDSFIASENQTESETAKRTVNLTHWSVELPESMTWEESTSGQTYQVDFYGTIEGKTIHLYTIYLGDGIESDVLGMYEADGEVRPLSVKTYTLESQGTWTEEEHTMAYAVMMETINDVIQVIKSDGRFTEEMP